MASVVTAGTAGDPIMRKIGGVARVGANGTRRWFDMVGVFPPDRNGMVQIAVTGDGKPMFFDLGRDDARRLALLILDRTE
jgi:hypothetical protein